MPPKTDKKKSAKEESNEAEIKALADYLYKKFGGNFPFVLNKYPFTELIPCFSEKKKSDDPESTNANVETLFIPSLLTDGSLTMLDFSESLVSSTAAVYPALMLLHLFITALDGNFSGTEVFTEEGVPFDDYPDIRMEGVTRQKHNPAKGVKQWCYEGRYYKDPNSGVFVLKCNVIVEILYKDESFGYSINEKLKEKAAAFMASGNNKHMHIEDPLRHKNAVNDPLTLIPYLQNQHIAGFLVHFVGMDPKFSMKEVVVKQVMHHNHIVIDKIYKKAMEDKNSSHTFHANSEQKVMENSVAALAMADAKARLPNSKISIIDITSMIKLINDFRKSQGLSQISVPDLNVNSYGEARRDFSGFFNKLPAKYFAKMPWTEKEMLHVLKRKKINPIQLLPRTYIDRYTQTPKFYIPIPPFAFQPERPYLVAHTILPIHVASSTLKNMGLSSVYSELYNLFNVSFRELHEISSTAEITLPDGNKLTMYQPFERVCIEFAPQFEEFWKKVNNSQNPESILPGLHKIRENAFSRLMHLCAEKSMTSRGLHAIITYLQKIQTMKESLCSLQPVFDDQDHVGNFLWNSIFNLNLGNNIYTFHTSVHLMILSAQSLFIRSFTYMYKELFQLHLLFISMPSMGKSFLINVLKEALVDGTYEEFHNFTTKAFSDSNSVDDFINYVCDEAAKFMCGSGGTTRKGGDDDSMEQKIDIWKMLLSENKSRDKRQVKIREIYVTHLINIIKRFQITCASNQLIRYHDQTQVAVLERQIVKIFPQAYCDLSKSWANVKKDEESAMNRSFKNAVSKILQNQHAFTALTSICMGSTIIRSPSLNLINLILTRLDASDAIFPPGQKPSNRIKGKIRTLYLVILCAAAYHQFHHNPLSPFIKFRDSAGQTINPKPAKPRHLKTQEEREEDDEEADNERKNPTVVGKGGVVDYKPFDMRDVLYIQTALAPSMTAAIHAVSAVVMDDRIAVHQIFIKLLKDDGIDVCDIRRAVRQLDEKRFTCYRIWASSDYEIDPMQKIPFFYRPTSHYTRTQVCSSGHHSIDDINPETGKLYVDNPRYSASFYEKMKDIIDKKKKLEELRPKLTARGVKEKDLIDKFNTANSEFTYSLNTTWGVRMRPDGYVKGDGIVPLHSFNSEAFTADKKVPVIGDDIPFVPPRPTSKSKFAFRPGTNPYAQYGVKPILDFPLTIDPVTGKVQGRVDQLICCLSDLGELTKAISTFLRSQVTVGERDRSPDSSFLAGACEALSFELPYIDPVDVALLPVTGEELAAYYSPDFLASLPTKPTRVFYELNTEDHGSIYTAATAGSGGASTTGGNNGNSRNQTSGHGGNNDSNSNFTHTRGGNNTLPVQGDSFGQQRAFGGQPYSKKNRVFAVSLMFCMMTPEALGEILIKTCTSKFTLPRKNIPLLCPDPRKPCSFLAADVVPGNAENISTMRISSDENTFNAMKNMIIDMEKKKAMRTGMSVVDDDDDTEVDQTEIEESDIPLEEVNDSDNPYVNGEDEEVFFTRQWNRKIGLMDPNLPNCPYNTIDSIRDHVQEIRSRMGPKESHITVSPVKGGVIDKVLEDALKGSASRLKKKVPTATSATDATAPRVVINHGFANQRSRAPVIVPTPIPINSTLSGNPNPQQHSNAQYYLHAQAPPPSSFPSLGSQVPSNNAAPGAPSLYSRLGVGVGATKTAARPAPSRIPSLLSGGIIHAGNRQPSSVGGIISVAGMEYATAPENPSSPAGGDVYSPGNTNSPDNYTSDVGSPATPQALPSTSAAGMSWQQSLQHSPMSARVPTSPAAAVTERRLSPGELRRREYAANFSRQQQQQQPKVQSPPAEYIEQENDDEYYADEDWVIEGDEF